MEIVESCLSCDRRQGRLFCDVGTSALHQMDSIKHATVYPRGAILFVEGQKAAGVFVLCAGRVKLSTSSSDGKTIIMRIAEAGEVLGLSGALSDRPYKATAETLDPCQIGFIERQAFLRYLGNHPEICLRVAAHLSNNYRATFEQVRSLGLSHTAAEKLARMLLECSRTGEERALDSYRLKFTLTHEEIAQMIGTSRETVTRLFSEFKHKRIATMKGSTLLIHDRAALQKMANC
jgi:CRP/FNR family transcriptional regulator